MASLRFTVAEDDAGSRLDRALAVRAEIGSRSLAERLVQEGSVLVDGVARPKSHRLEPGSTIEVALPAAVEGVQAQPVTVRVLLEDEHLVVVDKPAGLTVHPGAGRRLTPSPRSSSPSRLAAATIPSGRASSTVWTAKRPDSSSQRDPSARTPGRGYSSS